MFVATNIMDMKKILFFIWSFACTIVLSYFMYSGALFLLKWTYSRTFFWEVIIFIFFFIGFWEFFDTILTTVLILLYKKSYPLLDLIGMSIVGIYLGTSIMIWVWSPAFINLELSFIEKIIGSIFAIVFAGKFFGLGFMLKMAYKVEEV